eukprot:490175-Rhodomonas_salina.1
MPAWVVGITSLSSLSWETELESLTRSGTNLSSVMASFGQKSKSFAGLVGGTGCESTSWWSDSAIVCKLSRSIPGS